MIGRFNYSRNTHHANSVVVYADNSDKYVTYLVPKKKLSGLYRDNQCIYIHCLVRLLPQFDYAIQSDNCNCPSIHTGEKLELLAKACHTLVCQVALYPFQLVAIEPPPADPFTSPTASAFEKDAVRRARGSYIFVHFVYGVHDNYTNQMHNGTPRLWLFQKKSAALLLQAYGPVKKVLSLRRMQNPMERIHVGVMRLSIE